MASPQASGRVGSLSPEQEKALVNLREDPEIKAARETDDHELLRFLRARKFDVKAAKENILEFWKWRKDNNVDSITDQPIRRGETLRKVFPSAYQGFDKIGRPLYIEKTGQIDPDTVFASFTDDEILWAHIWGQEHQIRRAKESSEKHGNHIETFTTIMDLTGLSANHRKCLKFTQAISALDSKFYPERMGHVYIINAPWIFPVLYNTIKGFLDPVTRAKITVVKGDFKKVLHEHFDLDQLPVEYGGTQPNVDVYDISELRKNLTSEQDALEYVTEQIGARKQFVVRLDAEGPAIFSWYFKTVAHDLSFFVEFEPKDKKKKFMVNNPARLQCDTLPVQGTFNSKEAGTCILTFDNSFSYFKGKTLQYFTSVSELSGLDVEDSKEIDCVVCDDVKHADSESPAYSEPWAPSAASPLSSNSEASNASDLASPASSAPSENAEDDAAPNFHELTITE